MEPERLGVKYFLAGAPALDLEAIVPVFHRWIQERSVEGLPIDVADYRHVQEGPGVVLIGHEADRALDLTGGRPGLLYRRKRSLSGGLPERLLTVFRGALLGCQALEAEPALGGRLRFRTDEVEITFLDRLRAPNRPETLEDLRAGLEEALGKLYAGLRFTLEPSAPDPRECLAVQVRAPGAPGVAALLARVGAAAPAGGR